MATFLSMTTLVSALAVLPSAMAGFDPVSKSNIAVYWGQNSLGQGEGPLAQQRLLYYCDGKCH